MILRNQRSQAIYHFVCRLNLRGKWNFILFETVDVSSFSLKPLQLKSDSENGRLKDVTVF